jgi:protein-L-isoaspartate O-methyltransferase
MAMSLIERKFSFLQTIVFKHLGRKFSTNKLKGIMDIAFILFEKVGCKFEVLSSMYLQMYQDIVAKELALVPLSKDDRVLVIGSGSLPATPVLIAQHTQAKIVSIDKDLVAVKQATMYVKTHHLDHQLSIHYAQGTEFPVEGFTVIFLLYGVKLPQPLLEYLADHINTNTRVILRTITDAQGNIKVSTIDLTRFQVKERIHTASLGSFDSFLLLKK